MLGLSPVMWFATACLIMGSGVAASVWGWIGDRSRGRRRCGACWYDMTSTAGLACPECGRAARDDRGLRRTRRRGRAIVWGVGAVMVGVWVMQASIRMGPGRGEGWTAWAPTTVVVLTAPLERDPRSPLTKAVWLRSRDMWRWQEAIWARREVGAATEADLLEWFHARRAWPAGQPMVLRLYPAEPFPTLAGPRLMTVRSTDGGPIRMSASVDSWDTRSFHGQSREPDWRPADAGGGEFEVPAMTAGRHEFELEMTLSGRWGASRTIRHTLVVDVKPPGPGVITPVSTPELDALVADSLRARAWDGGPHGVWIWMDSQTLFDALYRATYAATRGTAFPDPEIAAVLQVLDGERVVHEFRVVNWGNDRVGAASDDELGRLAWNEVGGGWRRDVLERLTVVVKGDLGLAVRSLEAPRYWAGEVRVPMKRVFEQTPVEER